MALFPIQVQPAGRPMQAFVCQAQLGSGTVVNVLEMQTEVGVFDFTMTPEAAVLIGDQLVATGRLGQLWKPPPTPPNGKLVL